MLSVTLQCDIVSSFDAFADTIYHLDNPDKIAFKPSDSIRYSLCSIVNILRTNYKAYILSRASLLSILCSFVCYFSMKS